ncbi:probable methyltransferase-like protein 24 isoform X2 [Salmo salar]|uniref:Probable methyltransferase-like protein 24 isoform X2 n=1 Tax=Salmo salar TaxID=8030 RepID=A0A1S3Q2K7_SALSA|nr:probable methyltransferase-like protein 24 isoform X2 [Salmo salar]|eukprot:XP_014033649.1 PREDICTED: methyltransferase-like protein 24 isoform X2 [Salmo salar]
MSAGGGVQRVLLLIIPMFLLALQLLVGLRLPRADHAGSPGAFKDGVAFTVISIEPERRSARQTGSLDFLRDETGASRGYEDENEMPIGDRERGRGFELQQWASGEPSFTAELERVIAYITTPQVNCSRVLLPGESQASQAPGALWLLCVEGWSLPSQGPPCVAYSFRFDPSGQHGDRASSGYRDDGFGGFRQYRAWLDWRTARGRKQKKKKGVLCSGSRTLKDIMETLGHHTVDFLYADLLSAEWRVLQNWAELGTLGRIRHLVATVHLQWAGFEVGGTEAEVVRYWFSVLQGLQDAGFRLVHSSPGAGKSVLRHQVDNAHSSYTLSWVNTGPIH